MPRHLKKTAANPTSGMPQTRQLAARGGACVSKGALIATQHLERRHQVDDFIRRHNGAGVVRAIDVESGVHLFIRVIRGRIFYQRDLVAKLSGITNSCLHTRSAMSPVMMSLWMPCFLSCKSKSVLAKPLEPQCSWATISPGLGSNPGRISPPHVPYSKLLCTHAAF